MHIEPNHKRIVSIRRSYDSKDKKGLVCRVGREWALVHVLDELRCDGWEFLRLKDMTTVRRRSFDSFANKVLAAERATEGIEHPDVPLDDTGALLRSLLPEPIIILECEGNDDFYLGKVMRVGSKSLVFQYLGVDGKWMLHPYRILLEDVTRVAFGDHYASMFAKYAPKRPEPESIIVRDRSRPKD